VPLYWGGFRYRWMGVQLLRVETIDGNDTESLQGDPAGRPPWRSPLSAASDIETTHVSRLLAVLRLRRPLLAVRGALAPFVPRLLWEASFVKAVTLFSFISVVNLGFDGFDFGRWVRMLFCTEYDLKARGWWRALSGLQSLVGLGLLALSLLSFFGHPFD